MLKKHFALALAVTLSISSAALAERRVTDSGAWTYDYDKTPYESIIFGGRTYGQFLQGHGNSSYDFEHFVNSEFGEIYAGYAALAVTYRDNMDEGLLAHWQSFGMNKTLVHPEGAENTSDDYYVYTPVDTVEGETLPLVVVNHGNGANARVCESFGWIEIAGREHFMLVMAENTDIEALHAIVADVTAAYPVDTHRLYITGTSMGGQASRLYAAAYPYEVAAIAPMNVAFGFTANENIPVETIAALKMPMLFVAGTADVYCPLPLENKSTSIMGGFDAWNTLLDVQGISDYHMTAEASAQLLESTTDLIEHYTGLVLPEAKVHNYINNRTFEIPMMNAAGENTLTLIIEENGSHEPLGYDAQFAWDFMRRFSRDPATGELTIAE